MPILLHARPAPAASAPMRALSSSSEAKRICPRSRRTGAGSDAAGIKNHA